MSFWAACLVGFYGLLRKNTLLPPSISSTSLAFLIRSDVVSVTAESFLLRVRQTKTIQFGQRVLELPFVRCVNLAFCPVTFLLRHLVASPLDSKRPLFSYTKGSSMVAWTHASFIMYLKSCLSKAGFPADSYSGHSFRRGGCTACFQAGLSITDIKLRGDWRSNAFEKYLYVPVSAIYNCAKVLSEFAGR